MSRMFIQCLGYFFGKCHRGWVNEHSELNDCMNYCGFRPHGGSFFLRFPDFFEPNGLVGWTWLSTEHMIWDDGDTPQLLYTRGRSLQAQDELQRVSSPQFYLQGRMSPVRTGAAGYDPDLLSWSGPTHWLWTLGWNLAYRSHNFDDQNVHLIFMLNSFYMLIHFVIHIVIHPSL